MKTGKNSIELYLVKETLMTDQVEKIVNTKRMLQNTVTDVNQWRRHLSARTKGGRRSTLSTLLFHYIFLTVKNSYALMGLCAFVYFSFSR